VREREREHQEWIMDLKKCTFFCFQIPFETFLLHALVSDEQEPEQEMIIKKSNIFCKHTFTDERDEEEEEQKEEWKNPKVKVANLQGGGQER
jgi:uncharacterized membrane protein